jgi:hypothetical protein
MSRTGLSRINMIRLASNKRIRDFILYTVKKTENRFLDIQTADNRTVLPLWIKRKRWESIHFCNFNRAMHTTVKFTIIFLKTLKSYIFRTLLAHHRGGGYISCCIKQSASTILICCIFGGTVRILPCRLKIVCVANKTVTLKVKT